MEGMNQIIQQRIEARKAEAHLKSILEYYVDNDMDYYEMKKHIDEFMAWVWKESPIA